MRNELKEAYNTLSKKIYKRAIKDGGYHVDFIVRINNSEILTDEEIKIICKGLCDEMTAEIYTAGQSWEQFSTIAEDGKEIRVVCFYTEADRYYKQDESSILEMLEEAEQDFQNK